ncbi:MAG TPA: CHAT domain-containing protein [Chitinophagaceae bacterium]|nr:CHAT domain-containing protein [Chitinophagaceae bacterium]
MQAKLILLLSFVCAWFVNYGNTGTSPEEILRQYREANTLFYSANPTDASDALALKLYSNIIQTLEHTASQDTILFYAYVRKGVLLEVKADAAAARQSYLKAIDYKKQLPQLSDSVLFTVYLYTGATCYHLNNYDSAKIFFDKAEMLLQQYPGQPDKKRLYNSLGALYYESGDYHQGRNYFTRALQATQPVEKGAIINIQNNIAACLYRLEMYNEALAIYHQIIRQKQFSSFIYQNMGNAYRGLGDYHKALYYFSQSDPTQATGVTNEMAYAYLQLKKPDSTTYYLDRAMAEQRKRGQVNRVEQGINHLYRAELLLQQGKPAEALNYFQQAIISFSLKFNNNSIYSNPGDFAGSFASHKLFDALRRKAMAFKKLDGSQKHLEASLQTSEAAVNLLRYIERSYETDDARLFLKKNAESSYREAFNTCIKLLGITGNKAYLEKAFILTEQNKASVLAVNVNERNIKRKQGIPEDMLQQERNLRFNIARLNLKSDAAGTDQQEAIATQKVAYEIELSKLIGKYEKINDYYNVKYRTEAVKVHDLQKSLRSNQALISFYEDDPILHAFVMTGGSFDHIAINWYKPQVAEFITELKQLESGKKYNAGRLSVTLYNKIVRPVMQFAAGKKEWIIIPDGILNYLPFEALQQKEDGDYLLQSKIISYHFSAELLRLSQEKERRYNDYKVLAFAPFANMKTANWQSLPSSREEIAHLPGKDLYNEAATRAVFMRYANKYAVVHLATHAVANTNNPGASYISFYPADTAEGKLYLEELYGVEMDSTALVIISACESGDGQLINSEGVISLSRGFAYAGCKSMVTSLWKANDKSTAIIVRKFHEYLQNGYSRSEALQKAKLDYINSEDVNKTPNYWAHLILIGDTEPLTGNNSKSWMWVVGGALILVPVIVWWRKKKKSTYS